jgi:hypothetical protein
VGGKNQNSLGLEYAANFSKSTEARFVGNHAINPVESHYDSVKGRRTEPRQIGSIRHLKFKLGKLLSASGNHLGGIVNANVA